MPVKFGSVDQAGMANALLQLHQCKQRLLLFAFRFCCVPSQTTDSDMAYCSSVEDKAEVANASTRKTLAARGGALHATSCFCYVPLQSIDTYKGMVTKGVITNGVVTGGMAYCSSM